MSVLEKLTEGIVERSLKQEGAALLEKWERTGLLEGLGSDSKKNGMARMLENQAAQLLKEASSMAGGDVQGFASVAFPIVRRVFGGLIANDLVSVQPMSLPSGLIFFMDFTHTDTRGAYTGRTGGDGSADSLYGGGVVGSELITGVTDITEEGGGFYGLNNGYASPLSGTTLPPTVHNNGTWILCATGTVGGPGTTGEVRAHDWNTNTVSAQNQLNAVCRHDADLQGKRVAVFQIAASHFDQLNLDNLVAIAYTGSVAGAGTDAAPSGSLVRRLTSFSGSSGENDATAVNRDQILMVWQSTANTAAGLDALISSLTGYDSEEANDADISNATTHGFNFPTADNFGNVGDSALGAVKGATEWLLESDATTVSGNFSAGEATVDIPEIDIKVDSVSVTAITKKLKAKWTPELGQDLNAYHNLDAEVELTSILSEQIALEIDREILEDLIKGATAQTYHWSRRPGRFVNRMSGAPVEDWSSDGIDSDLNLLGGDFTGTVSEWYETLVETINDVSAQIHRKTLRGGANFLVCGPEVANILEFTSGFRASVTADADKGTVGAVKAGSISKKWDVWVDPYFPRNVILVGRKGGSFLESGYVYAPYVPLQVTPTIFGTEDFVPRKGVMTRYAKKMVRPDMYGLVVVQHLLG